MSIRNCAVAAVAASILCSHIQASPAWETGSYDPDAWTPSANNLIANVVATDGLSYYDENNKTMAQNTGDGNGIVALTDGVVPGSSMDYTKVTGIIGGTLAWGLTSPVNLTEINIFTRWGDGGRDGIAIDSVAVLYDGESEWTTLDSVPALSVGMNDNNSCSHYYATLSNASGFIAQGIRGVKLTFGTQDNGGAGYVEIEACGISADTPRIAVQPASVTTDGATIEVTVLYTGSAATGDLYFDFGQNQNALSPALVASGLSVGDTYNANFSDLASSTKYYYQAYLVAGGAQSETRNGFIETDRDIYRGLPSRYSQVEYVTTTGSQYLNTGVQAGPTIGATLDFVPLAYTGAANLGTQAGNDNNDWRFFNYSGGSMFDVGTARIGFNASTILSNGTRYTVEIGNAFYSVSLADGTPVWSGTGAVQASADIVASDIYLAAMGTGSGANNATPMTVYSLVMTDGAQVVRDFVPCYDTVDDCYGLYDVATSAFNGFIGNDLGAITAGATIAPPETPFATIEATALNPWDVTLVATVTNDGDSSQDLACDLYFAWGTPTDILVPVKVADGLHLGDTHQIAISNLNDSTSYSYSFYVVNSQGSRQTQTKGGFTTAYAVPATVETSLAYCTTTNCVINAEITTFGQDAASADLYFAIGADSTALSPTLFLANVPLEETVPIASDGLSANTIYYWSAYAINDLGHKGPSATGYFKTMESDAFPKWTGAIDSSWSNPGNWEPVTTFTDGETNGTIILNCFPGGNPPSDYDVDIAISRLMAGPHTMGSFSISGNDMRWNAYVAYSEATGTITFDNDVEFIRIGYGNAQFSVRNTSVVFNGVVSDDGQLAFLNSDSDGNLYFNNPENTFSLPVNMHSGSIHVGYGRALGSVDPDKVAQYGFGLNNNWGGINFENVTGRHYNIFELETARTLAGPFNIANETTDLFFDGELKIGGGNGDLSIGGTREKRGFFKFGGTLGDMKGRTVTVQNGIVAVAESAAAFGCETNPVALKTYFGTFDFNGHDSWNTTFFSYTEAGTDPAYINNDLETPVTFHGTMATDLCCETPLVGGAGSVIHRGGVARNRNSTDEYFKKGDVGSFTLAGPDYSLIDFAASKFYGGEMIFDYRDYNTFRFLGNGDAYVWNCHLKFLGNDAAKTEVAVGNLVQFADGYTVVETIPGAAGMDFSIGQLGTAAGQRAVDFRFGDGTAVAVTGALANQGNFPGISASVTIDNGRNWAYCDSGNATVTALPVSLMTAETIEDNSVANLTASSGYSLDTRKQPYGIRFANTNGPVTLTLNAGLYMGTHGGDSTCAFLISPDSAGDVTIDGNGIINNTWGNCAMLFHNYLPTNYTFAIHARIDNPNNNAVMFVGPGVTLLDNDGNNFYNGPHAYGGQTIRFTSMSNSGTSCSLGGGYNNEMRMFCSDATYEYVGTAPEGHAGNRRFQMRGPVTVKANGVGPIRFTDPYFAVSDFASNIVTLDGEGEGIIDGVIWSGNYGRLIKQGTGTWTINSTGSVFMYGTEIKEGTLVLNGALPSDVVVRSGATLVLGPGAVLKRSLVVEDGATLVVDPTAEAPATVWGRATLAGDLALSDRMPQGLDVSLLTTENGTDGSFSSVPSNIAVSSDGTTVTARPRSGLILLLR